MSFLKSVGIVNEYGDYRIWNECILYYEIEWMFVKDENLWFECEKDFIVLCWCFCLVSLVIKNGDMELVKESILIIFCYLSKWY